MFEKKMVTIRGSFLELMLSVGGYSIISPVVLFAPTSASLH